jgi:S-formylglutathione hydrolase
MKPNRERAHKQLGGETVFFSHDSEACQGRMTFAAFLPPQAQTKKLPVVYWLSGLTCTPEIFMTEAQAQSYAKKHELILVAPDTSPRNTGIDGEDDSYDLGSGASFYVDATLAKWSKHYRMDTYITRELRTIVENELPVDRTRQSIFGHSMGGHGALVLGLRNPTLYRSISAFAPICAPSHCPWGEKAFTEYLGTDRKRWAEYDAEALVRTTQARVPVLVDQGTSDEYLQDQLHPDALERAFKETGYPGEIRRQPGYDHSYFFISSFIDEHLAFHARHLKA